MTADYEYILNQVIIKLSELNHLACQLPLHIQADVYHSAKRHFYLAQCAVNKELKVEKNGNKRVIQNGT